MRQKSTSISIDMNHFDQLFEFLTETIDQAISQATSQG